MVRFNKCAGKDFTVLNLTDIQLCDHQWDKNDPNYDNAFDILDHTVRTLVSRVKPDLITVTGDIGHYGAYRAYPAFGRYIDQFGVPWCVVWGNHDHQNGKAFLSGVVACYRTGCKHFFFEEGDAALGNGNYLIEICHDGRPLHALFMMDSHNRSNQPDETGKLRLVNDRINAAQLAWYRENAASLIQRGCAHSSMMLHIPIYAYNEAWDAAFDPSIEITSVSVSDSYRGSCWNQGYQDAFGVRYESMPLGPYPYDDGVFAVVKESGITQRIIAGHDHINNFCIPYQGIDLLFATHTGKGCYWHKDLNGATVLTIEDTGAARVRQEYVDVTHLLKEYDR